ncbi:hypothetical protein [Nitrincola alkalisediminis]|uniref:hypothetical protein n=1 Tax=Nitrincola alkalisediminis TaxID=1366656 RepID=UPI001873DFD0|nr:hypothetical protein [Nitrincola alkalisediminis]
MTTALEILDTTVKIGLGALISGLSTYFLATKRFSHEINKSKLDAKNDLVKEAALKCEDSIFYLSLAVHRRGISAGFAKEGLEEMDHDNSISVSESLMKAKTSMNHAESLASLSGLVKLADCLGEYEYEDDLDEMHSIFSNRAISSLYRVQEMIDGFSERENEIKRILATAYDEIYT